MITNPLYEKILGQFEQHKRYTEAILIKEKSLEERKKEIAKILIDSEFEEDVEQIAFEAFTEISLYRNDLRVVDHRLYVLVDGYVEMKDLEPKLPQEVVELCQALEPTIPKNNFYVDENAEIKEKEKGFIDKVKETQKKSGAMKELIEHLKNMLNV